MFWRTPVRQMEAIVGGAKERVLREHNDRAWQAWTTAALMRKKKLPDLKRLLSTMASDKPHQTWQQQLAIMDRWVAHTQRRAQRQGKKPNGH